MGLGGTEAEQSEVAGMEEVEGTGGTQSLVMEVSGGEVKVVAVEDKSGYPHHHPRCQGRGPMWGQ